MKATKGYIISAALLMSAFTFTGCQLISQAKLKRDYVAKADVEQKIEDLKGEYTLAAAQKNKEIQDQADKAIKSLKSQMQAGANSLYGANEGFKFYDNPTRLDLIINNRVTEAQAAIGMAPTYEAIQAENERLKIELDEKKTTIEELTKKHKIVVSQNEQLVKDTKKVEDDLEKKKNALVDLTNDYNLKKDELDKLDKKLSDKILEATNEQLARAKDIAAMKNKLMIGAGIAALVFAAAAIYSPVGKRGLVILAVTSGCAAVAIPFIEGWMILVGFLGVVACVIGKYLYDHHITDKTNDNLINAIEDTKQTADTTTVTTLKSNLKSWNSQYIKKSGLTLLTTDHAVENLIKSKLKKFGRLKADAPPSSSSSGSFL